MRMRQLPLALTLALAAAEADALGFGEIEVRSRLNEPLDAWIRLASADEEELATLVVKLASGEDYARLGLRRQAVPVAVEFTVERDREGRPAIRVRSRQPVREPVLPLLVDAQWSKGRMLKEFVVLLDPPLAVPAVAKVPAVRPARVEEPLPAAPRETIAAPAQEASRPIAPPPPSPPRREAAPAAEPAPSPMRPQAPEPFAPARGGEYGPVAAGETLWQIALSTRPAEVDVQQMLIAIFEANPSAFIDGNINLLRRGVVLRIPSAEEVRAIDRSEARRRVAEHSEAWRARGGMPAPARFATPVEAPPATATREEPRERPRAQRPRPEDRLAILPPAGEETRALSVGRSGGMPARDAEIEGLRADLQRSRESLAAAEQELSELRSRVRELEKIESDQQRLIALKDSELAELRQRLAELEERLRQAEATSSPVALPAPDEPGAPAPAPSEEAIAASPPAEATTAAPPPPQPAPARAARPATPERAPAPPPPPPVEEAPWYLRPPILGGLVAFVLLLIGLVWLGRRRSAEAPAEKSLASRLVAAAPPPAAGGEERLKELRAAVEANPTDLQAHLALLRFLYNREDAVGFEMAAESMAGYVGEGASPEWEEVLTMGREIAPEHPLFRQPRQAAPAPTPEEEPVPELALTNESPPSPPAETAPAAPPASLESPELELPPWRPEEEEEAPPAEELSAAAQPSPAFDTVTTQRMEGVALDLGGNWETQRISQADVERAMADRAPAESGIPLGDVEDDVVATKLGLAREYLDLGDADSARSLLEEVLSEGSPAQKAEAQRLLAQIR